MKVRVKASISGLRNGEPWPRKGEVIDVPDDEGAALCDAGLAAPVRSDKDDVETRGKAKPKGRSSS